MTSVDITDLRGSEVAVSYVLSIPRGVGVTCAITQPHQIIKFKHVERVKFNPKYLANPFHFTIEMKGVDEASAAQVAEQINKLEGANNMRGGPFRVHYFPAIGFRMIEGEMDSTLYTEEQARHLLENASSGVGVVGLFGGNKCHDGAGDTYRPH